MSGMFRRITNLMNRVTGRSGLIRSGKVAFDFNANTLYVGSRVEHLELKQSMVLVKLMADSPSVVSKDQLLSFGWHGAATGDDVLAVAVSHLRKSLGDSVRSPRYIKTIAGQGYQWVSRVGPGARQMARTVVYGETATKKAGGRQWWAIGLLLLTVATSLLVLNFRPDPLVEAAEILKSDDADRWPEALALYEQAWMNGNQSVETVFGVVDAQWKILQDQPRQLYRSREEIRAWLKTALAAEPRDARVHFRLAQLEFLVDWDTSSAYRDIKKALALDPKNADYYLFQSYLQLALGEFARSSESLEAARAIDPSHYAREMAAWIYNMQRDYEQASLELERLVRIRPGTLNYHVSAQSVQENSGDHDGSFGHLLKVLELVGYETEALDEAERIFEEQGLDGVYQWLLLERGETRNIGQYRPPLARARYAIRAGDLDAAMEWLEQAVQERQYELLWISVDPKYDPLRGDPRFDSLVRSIGLPLLNNS